MRTRHRDPGRLLVAAAAVTALPAAVPAQQADAPLAGRSKGSATAPGHGVRDVGLPVPLLPPLRAGRRFPSSSGSTSPPARCAGSSSTFRSPASTQRGGGGRGGHLRREAGRVLAGARPAVHASGHLGAAQGAGAFPRHAGGLRQDLPADAARLRASPDTRTEIQSEAEGSERAGANSTPTFYIEGGLMSGAQPVEVFRQVLDSVVATKHRPGT